MIQKNVPLLILSGIIMGVVFAFVAMSVVPLQPAGNNNTVLSPQPVMQLKVTPGAEVLPRFSSAEEARAFVRSHLDNSDTPQLLTTGTRLAESQTGVLKSGTRTWQFDIDTSTYKPDEYIVTAQAVVQDATGTALFNLLDRSEKPTHDLSQQRVPLPATNGSFITVNHIGDYYVGDKITITGQTNLAADDEILVQVYSSSFKPTQKSQSGEFSGSTGTVRASSSSSPSSSYSSASPAAASQALPADPGRKYSTTNVQVRDVDEADIVKTDGTYIYVVTGNYLHILKGYPATSAGIIATLQFSGTPQSLYVNGDRLVLISSTQEQNDFRQCRPGACSYTIPVSQKTQMFVYSVNDPAHPALVREMELDGLYKDSRMIGSTLYFVMISYLDPYDGGAGFPAVYDSARGSVEPPVYYFDRSDREFYLTTIGAVDIRATEPVNAKTFLIGSAGTVYVSPDTLFIAVPANTNDRTATSTDLYSFALDNGQLTWSARGTIDGTLLNQFSLDEYGGNLRVATTIQDYSRTGNGPSSKVTVLDGRLRVVGSVGNLAPTQQIYAARFMGERLYLVTYRETDPLFVIELGDPEHPKVLGELHIPGFSRYLHPYDTTHLIGVGKESTRGSVKLALFDVADVNNPRLVSGENLGGYGSDSEVLRDHKAFLFDKEKDILVLPVHIVENSRGPDGVQPVWGGAYVFGVNPDKGFTLKGTVVHYRDKDTLRHVQRAFTIEDVLYTMASDKIVMSDLKNGTALIGVVGLP
jgi:inhibitor of cysteine peptidase